VSDLHIQVGQESRSAATSVTRADTTMPSTAIVTPTIHRLVLTSASTMATG
jgi:hypothetical protein